MAEPPYPLLVTGFSAFPGVPENPTEALMHRLRTGIPVPGAELDTHVLPTTYAAVDDFVATHIADANGPHSTHLAFGVARDPWLRLESHGHNRIDADSPDASGVRLDRDSIAPQTADLYQTSLPLLRLRDRLATADLPVKFSDDAGSYLCNYLYYSALHATTISERGLSVVFIHVPPLSPAFTLDDLERAGRICIAYIIERRG